MIGFLLRGGCEPDKFGVEGFAVDDALGGALDAPWLLPSVEGWRPEAWRVLPLGCRVGENWWSVWVREPLCESWDGELGSLPDVVWDGEWEDKWEEECDGDALLCLWPEYEESEEELCEEELPE